MLKDLDTIHWQHLTHAYGNAKDIPTLVRSLLSSELEVGEHALDTLLSCIFHQGTVYEATSLVIPFLVELLTIEKFLYKKHLLLFFADLALRCSVDDTSALNEDQDEDPWPIDHHYTQEIIEDQHKLCEEISQNIAKGWKIYLSLLKNHNPEIRVLIPYLLSSIREKNNTRVSVLLSHFSQEEDPLVKTSLLIALNFCQEYGKDDEPFLRTLLTTKHEHLLVRTFASVFLAQSLKEDTPEEAIHVLLEALLPIPELEFVYQLLPWSHRLDHSIISIVCHSLSFLNNTFTDRLIARLLEALAQLEKQTLPSNSRFLQPAYDIVCTLLECAFARRGLPIQSIPFCITTTQRKALIAILTSPLVINMNQDIAQLMEYLGFPYLWKMRILLNLDRETKY